MKVAETVTDSVLASMQRLVDNGARLLLIGDLPGFSGAPSLAADPPELKEAKVKVTFLHNEYLRQKLLIFQNKHWDVDVRVNVVVLGV